MGLAPLTKKVVIASSMNDALGVAQELVDAAQARGYNEHSLFAIRLALDEALTNAIRHGNANDPAKRVTVEYSVADDEVNVSITDEGPGFRPEELPDPTLDENLERPCGRGVMLIKAYMTKVSYNNSGNRVTMTKLRSCRLPLS